MEKKTSIINEETISIPIIWFRQFNDEKKNRSSNKVAKSMKRKKRDHLFLLFNTVVQMNNRRDFFSSFF